MTMKVKDIIKELEEFAPLCLQESYDNAGLIVGNPDMEVRAVLCTVDITAEIIEEALGLNANMIVAHHPLIFGNLKALTGNTYADSLVIKAIKNDLAIYASHTNLDNIAEGVNHTISQKLGLINTRILSPAKGLLFKLVTFVPSDHANSLREALFAAGAGHIGNYDSCSYNLEGRGTFRGNEKTNPYVGEKGILHQENEVRIETIVPKPLLNQVIDALTSVHPYEEAAYDIYPLENRYSKVGSGMVGEFSDALSHKEFMTLLGKVFHIPVIRYSGTEKQEYKRIALCGGSGSFLTGKAAGAKADAFLTADIKYHQFFETPDNLLICDIGHYESEQFTKEIFYSLLTKKFSTFAVHLSSIVTNPIKYFV
jgi:dinuclear metal center YbgI/SA1388 family protein